MEIRTSPQVQAAMEAKRPAKLWLAWVGVFGTSVLVVQVVIAPTLLVLVGADEGDASSQLVELVANAVTILVVAVWVVRYERRAFRSVGFRGGGVGEFLGGFVGGVVLFSLPMLGAVVAGSYEFGASEHTATGTAALLPVVLLIPTRDIAILDYGPVDGASAAMTGGDFGIEGSVVATVVLVVACLLSYRYYRGIEATRQMPAPLAGGPAD